MYLWNWPYSTLHQGVNNLRSKGKKRRPGTNSSCVLVRGWVFGQVSLTFPVENNSALNSIIPLGTHMFYNISKIQLVVYYQCCILIG